MTATNRLSSAIPTSDRTSGITRLYVPTRGDEHPRAWTISCQGRDPTPMCSCSGEDAADPQCGGVSLEKASPCQRTGAPLVSATDSQDSGCLKGLAGTSAAEKAEAFQVIAPVEVIRPVVVIGEFNCVVLPETHPRSSSVDWGHLEAECAVLPWLVALRGAPSKARWLRG